MHRPATAAKEVTLTQDELKKAVAQAALKHVVEEYLKTFAGMQDEYMRERAQDVKDVGLRLLRNLLGVEEQQRTVAVDSVLVAEEVSISDLVLIDHRRLRGIVLATGGVTSHATILAKSFEIPTVVGAEGAPDVVSEGDDLLVDGNAGAVFVNPAADVLRIKGLKTSAIAEALGHCPYDEVIHRDHMTVTVVGAGGQADA